MTKSPSDLLCPSCEEGQLAPIKRSMTLSHEGSDIEVNDLDCYQCASCSEEVVFPNQLSTNNILVAEAKRRASKLLSGSTIKSIREAFGLSQPEAAKCFGGGAKAFSKYECGVVIQSEPMDNLLYVAAMFPQVVDALKARAALRDAGVNAAWNAGINKTQQSILFTDAPIILDCEVIPHALVNAVNRSIGTDEDWFATSVPSRRRAPIMPILAGSQGYVSEATASKRYGQTYGIVPRKPQKDARKRAVAS